MLIYHWVINNGTFSSFSLSEDDGKVGIHIFPSTYGSFSGRQNSGGSGGGSPTRRSANGGSQLGHSICVARVTADEFDPTRTVDEDGGVGEGASPSASSSQQSIAGGAGTGWRWTKPKCCRHSRCEALARSRQMLGQRGVLDNEEGSAGGLLALMMSCKRL